MRAKSVIVSHPNAINPITERAGMGAIMTPKELRAAIVAHPDYAAEEWSEEDIAWMMEVLRLLAHTAYVEPGASADPLSYLPKPLVRN